MKMRLMLVSGFLFVAAATNTALAFSETFLYTVACHDAVLRTVDPSNAETIWSVDITLGDSEITGATGLAIQPGTDELFALLNIDGSRVLATIDPRTGDAQLIGETDDEFTGISFASNGVLYGVTGDDADTPESLFTLSLDDASSTFALELGDGNDGETIGFDTDNGLMYHASGRSDDAFFQSINLDDHSIMDVALSGDVYDEAFALAYAGGGRFYLPDLNRELFTVDVDGVVTDVGGLDHQAKGMVFVPEPGTLALLGIGALALVRRRARR